MCENNFIRLRRMCEMWTIVTDVSGVCPSVCLVAQLNFIVWGHSVQFLSNLFGLLYLINLFLLNAAD